MFSDSFKYPGISSWDTGLLPQCFLLVGILEYSENTLQVPIVELSFVESDPDSFFFLSINHSMKQFTNKSALYWVLPLKRGFQQMFNISNMPHIGSVVSQMLS